MSATSAVSMATSVPMAPIAMPRSAVFGVGGGAGLGLRSGGPLAIIFSLVCIGIAAFSFLIDFDAADQMVRAGAPEKAAWGIALGLTVTLVWLYIEILRLLSYLQND